MAGPSSTHNGWWRDIANSQLEVIVAGTSELTLDATSIAPTTNDGIALGTTALGYSDQHLATGAVINWANGEVTLTEATNSLTLGGGDLVVGNGNGVVIGHTAQLSDVGQGAYEFQVLGNTDAADGGMLVGLYSADGAGAELVFVKGRGSIGAADTIVTGDNIGLIRAFAEDGTTVPSESARIQFDTEGTIGNSRIPGNVRFFVANSSGSMTESARLGSSGAFTAHVATGGIGYGAGAGGTVAQGAGSGKATAATLNTVCGAITIDDAELAADTTVSFTLTNSAVEATDSVIILHESAGTLGAYSFATTAGAGSVVISIHNNTPGALSDAIVLRMLVIKSVSA